VSTAAPRQRKTVSANETTVHSWYIADVQGKTLGRACAKIASVLRGKNKAVFTPHANAGDFVIVVNAEKIRLTGKKWSDKVYRHHSLFPGGLQEYSAKQLVERHPTELVKRAVWGMLPKGPLGRQIYKKLKVYAGTDHPHAAQQPKPLALS
jgi:large subunit ribosomal protein L13